MSSRQLVGSVVAIGIAAVLAMQGCAGDDGPPSQNAGSGGSAGLGPAGMNAAGVNAAGTNAGGMNAGGTNAAGMNAAGTSAGGAGGGGGAGGASATGPTFTRVWTEVLVAKGCAGELCHGSAQGGLSMDDRDDAYMNLVGVAAAGPLCSASGKMRVQPMAPDASLLLEKMAQPMPSCGEMMPIGAKLDPNCLVDDPSACNTAAELQLVRDWIAAGALDD